MVFQSVSSSNSNESNWNQVNDLAREVRANDMTQVFKGPNSTQAIIIGRYSDSRYGLVIADETGTRRVLIGQAPDDGRPGVWVSIDGVDVVEELS